MQFYSPKYKVNTPVNPLDQRSTIYWQPTLIADTTGNAKFSFYAASKPATYTVNIQGTDMNGRFGFHTFKINIKSKTQ
jgi:hypothetical protein